MKAIAVVASTPPLRSRKQSDRGSCDCEATPPLLRKRLSWFPASRAVSSSVPYLSECSSDFSTSAGFALTRAVDLLQTARLGAPGRLEMESRLRRGSPQNMVLGLADCS